MFTSNCVTLTNTNITFGVVFVSERLIRFDPRLGAASTISVGTIKYC